jgi:hypothetical protein
MTNYTQALIKLRPGAKFTIKDNDYNNVEWHKDNQPIPTKEECDAVDTSVEEAEEAENMAKQRARGDRVIDALWMLAKFVYSKHPDMPDELKNILKEVGEI